MTALALTLPRKALAEALAVVARIVPPRSTIPIIANVLLTAEGTSLRLRGTDLDMQVAVACPAEVAQPGAATVAARLLLDVVRKGGADDVSLRLEPAGLVVRCGRARTTLATLATEDFPDMPPIAATVQEHAEFAMEGQALAAMLEATAFALSTEETRYYLCGVFWHVRGEHLVAVATNGHVLSRIRRPVPEGADAMPGVILPARLVGELQRLAEGADSVTLRISPRLVEVEAGDVSLLSKVIDGTFPDYERVIPRESSALHVFQREEMEAAVERVGAMASKASGAVALTLGDGACALRVVNPDAGEATDEIEAETAPPAAAPLTIGFAGRYILQVCAALSGDTATLGVTDAGSPSLWTGADPDLLAVVMPMRV